MIRPFDNIAYYPDEKEPWEYTWIEFNGEKYASLLNRIDFARDNCIIGAVDRESIMAAFRYYKPNKPRNAKEHRERHGFGNTGVYADMFENHAKSGENDCFDSARSLIENNFHKPDFDLSAGVRRTWHKPRHAAQVLRAGVRNAAGRVYYEVQARPRQGISGARVFG